MRLFKDYIRSQRPVLAMLAAFFVLFAGAFALYRLPLMAVIYPAVLCAFMGAAFLMYGYTRCKTRVAALERALKKPDGNPASLPAPLTPCESAYHDGVLALQKELSAQRIKAEEDYRDRMDYYTVWAHQVKTPLASMQLALENEDSPLARQLRADLLHTRQYVDMALAFPRLDSDSTDLVLREYTVDQLVKPSLKKYSTDFIRKKLSLRYEPSDKKIITDEKWFAFVLEQLLSNALKYTAAGGIRVSAGDGYVLCVEDSGIGIAPEDLPRIFEKGYTGQNGRLERTASGLGLYLCRRVCDQIGLRLRIESRIGRGTKVYITAAQEKRLME